MKLAFVVSNGWDESASAWIADMADRGDYSRRFVLDEPMVQRVRAKTYRVALDVGCGEGRFCRTLGGLGLRTIGIDPTAALLAEAKRLDPLGDYRLGVAEHLDFTDDSFDLVVSYLTLVDIQNIDRAIHEMVRVLAPGGTLLVANLNGFATAAVNGGWTASADGTRQFCIDHYLSERAEWTEWRGIRILNWHRPLSRYVSLLIAEGLTLRYFDEPAPGGGDVASGDLFTRVPLFVVMEWEKPDAEPGG